MDWAGRQLNSPAIQSSVGAGAVIFGARSWVAWSSFPDGWMGSSSGIATNSLRSVYMTLLDCSGLTLEETAGLKSLASGYFCYSAKKEPAPPPPPGASTTSATFHVQSGSTGCSTTHSGRCVVSPNYPSEYKNNDHCTITISDTASLSATNFETESASCEPLPSNFLALLS